MENLKRDLCNYLIKNNMVKKYDVIKHSYTNARFNDWQHRNVECNNICNTLDTRCDCIGVVVNDMIINPLKDKSPYGWHFEQNVYDVNGETRSVKASQGSGNMLKIIEENEMENNLRIRKLTPKECFRLMGVKDEDSNRLNHLSNATKYHLAGDSIVVNVLQAIFKSILIDNPVVENKPIRLIEFFAGYGSQALALKYLNIPFEHWRTCEWAIKSIDAYKHIHFPNINEDHSDLMDKEDLVEYLYGKGISSNWNEPMKESSILRKSEKELRDIYNNIKNTNNLVNIQQVHADDLEIKERDKYNYILTYSFPCQDLSLAGKGAGMEKGSGTRSGMLWEVERILKECDEKLPQILLMENVPQVVGKKNKEDFDTWVEFLESKGYTNKYCMLNAKEVGYPEPIPQNRNRCFMISVLNPKQEIIFPEKTERKLVLKDILEDNVDEKYYLSDDLMQHIQKTAEEHEEYTQYDRYNGDLEMWCRVWKDKSPTLNTKCKDTKIYCNNKSLKETLEQNKIDDTCYIDTYNKRIDKEKSGTITTGVSFRNNTFLAIKNATKQGYLEVYEGDGIDIGSRMQYHRGNVQKESIQTITTAGGNERGVVIGIKEEKWSDLD